MKGGDIMQEENEKKISPVAAGITGLIIGVVSTAAIALSDKEIRKKAMHNANDLKDNFKKWSQDTLHDVKGSDFADEASSKLESASTKTRETVKDNTKSGKIDETLRSKIDEDL
jgi:hypothetical protein